MKNKNKNKNKNKKGVWGKIQKDEEEEEEELACNRQGNEGSKKPKKKKGKNGNDAPKIVNLFGHGSFYCRKMKNEIYLVKFLNKNKKYI